MSLATIRQRDPVAAFAISRTLPLEGGFVDDAADHGGATNRGVSLRFALAEIKADPGLIRLFDVDHNGTVDRKDIAGLSADDAAEVYFATYWLTGWYGKLTPQLVAWKCFDIAVNTGPNRAALLLQKALYTAGAFVEIDAHIGPQTVAAVQLQAARDQGATLLNAIRTLQADFYRGLVAKEPSFKRFLNGWLSRAGA